MASSDPTATGMPLAAVVPLEGQPLAPEDNFPFTLAGDQEVRTPAQRLNRDVS